MRIAVKHVTNFEFSDPTSYSIHHIRLMPRPALGQRIVYWRISAPGRLTDWSDGYGNQVRTFVVQQPHSAVQVAVEGLFESEGETGGSYLSYASDEPLPAAFWLRNQGRARHDQAIGEYVEDLGEREPGERVSVLHELMGRIHEDIEFAAEPAEPGASAGDILRRRTGKCQDFAHLFVACCRRLEIPARYVSGYMRAVDQSQPAEASHAWAEAYVPFLGWIGFDPMNRLCPNANYLKLAVGTDCQDAGPMIGARTGGGAVTRSVDIEVMSTADA